MKTCAAVVLFSLISMSCVAQRNLEGERKLILGGLRVESFSQAYETIRTNEYLYNSQEANFEALIDHRVFAKAYLVYFDGRARHLDLVIINDDHNTIECNFSRDRFKLITNDNKQYVLNPRKSTYPQAISSGSSKVIRLSLPYNFNEEDILAVALKLGYNGDVLILLLPSLKKSFMHEDAWETSEVHKND